MRARAELAPPNAFDPVHSHTISQLDELRGATTLPRGTSQHEHFLHLLVSRLQAASGQYKHPLGAEAVAEELARLLAMVARLHKLGWDGLQKRRCVNDPHGLLKGGACSDYKLHPGCGVP